MNKKEYEIKEFEIKEFERHKSPAWLITFADLLALLLSFFILLLSFSEMNLQKYKYAVTSLGKAFHSKKGANPHSFVPKKEIISYKQLNIDELLSKHLNKFNADKTESSDLKNQKQKKQSKPDKKTTSPLPDFYNTQNAEKFAENFIDEIRIGNLELEIQKDQILIRILEKGSFTSGSSELKNEFFSSLEKISKILEKTPGKIIVAGFTDNIPINNDNFTSNWELSASRAASVVSELLKNKNLDSKRFILAGFADNRPLAPNNSAENRKMNRRIELTVIKEERYMKDGFIKIEKELDNAFEQNFNKIKNNNSGGGNDVETTFPSYPNTNLDAPTTQNNFNNQNYRNNQNYSPPNNPPSQNN